MIQTIMRYVIDAFIVISIFFAFAGVVGMIRMPDCFCRMQSSTNIATLGVLGVIVGGILYSIFMFITPDWGMVAKLAAMGVFYIVTNPIAGHAVARAAYRRGGAKDAELKCDKYGEDMENAD
ncbi:MAG: monovalent cation/H(+) antiporter subunit G [Oscillospiraceae bacterium]|nr:monovalent cation/H(+) antiporter subunit G [Oscillospiraceae bacterium]